MLLTIAGAHCSGKTTAGRACAGLPGLAVHDFDELGVPSDADTQWRHRTMEEWLQRVLAYQADGIDVLLTGQSPLGEVLACPSAPKLNGIAACLLDVSDAERLRRLELRDPGRYDEEAKRRCLGWAAWHRSQAADPRWTVHIIDTTGCTKSESAAKVRAWIRQSRAGHSLS